MTTHGHAHDLADRLLGSLFCEHPAVLLHVMRFLADGRPVAIAQLASALHTTPEIISAELRRFSNTEYDAAGNVVAAGLSLTPTPHQFQVRGQILYTWCALDTLIFPTLLDQSARVASPCPVTGEPITLVVSPEGIDELAPAGAVVSLVVPARAEACCDVRGSFCNHVHFFSSAQAAATWQATNPDALILTVPDAAALARTLVQRRFGELLIM